MHTFQMGEKYAFPPFISSPYNNFFSPTCYLTIFLQKQKKTPLQIGLIFFLQLNSTHIQSYTAQQDL